MKELYPNVIWTVGRFKHAPKGTWTNKEDTRAFLEYIEGLLYIKNREEDWYRISKLQAKS